MQAHKKNRFSPTDLFEGLRKSYKPPDHHRMGGPLLQEQFGLAQADAKAKASEAECVVIMCDGWTNQRTEGLLNFLMTTPHPVFLKTIEQGANREDSDFVASKMKDVIREVDGPDNKVFLLISDFAPVMRAAWRKVQEEYPHIYAVGCGCHGLDLNIKHIVAKGYISTIYKKVRACINTFRKKKVVKANFKLMQVEKYHGKALALKLPSKTRFFGASLCLESLIVNKAALQATVIIEDLDISYSVRSALLDNEDFWSPVIFVSRLIKPIADGIKIIEANDAKLSHLVAVLMNITVQVNNILNEDETPLSLGETRRISGIIPKFTKFILRDIHLAAYLVDPNFCGRGLGDENKTAATNVIKDIANSLKLNEDEVLESLLDFQTKTNFFRNETLWKPSLTTDSSKWWKAFCSKQPLYPVAARLMSCVPSATGCERTWSDYEHVHNKKRNKLLNERTGKLVAVKQYLNQEEVNKKWVKKSESLRKLIETLTSYPTVDLGERAAQAVEEILFDDEDGDAFSDDDTDFEDSDVHSEGDSESE